MPFRPGSGVADPPVVDLATRTHRRMLVLVGVIVVATISGMVLLWPSAAELPTPDTVPDPLVEATITGIERYQGEPDEFANLSGARATLELELDSGPEAGTTPVIDLPLDGYPEFDVGDEVLLSRSEMNDGSVQYFVTDFQRLPSLLWLTVLFAAVVVLIGRWQGVRSLLGLLVSLVIVVRFVVPGILAGEPPAAVALVGALAVLLTTLYLSHGVNEMTTSAVIGTAAALAVTIGLGLLVIDRAGLTGFASEEATLARFQVAGLDLQGLVLAGLIIAALGVLDDVTVTQSSAVFAIHDADRTQSWPTVFARAMTVGRDHIASTVNTLVLAYAGASLALLVLFSTAGLPMTELVNSEVLAEEIVKTLVGSLGLIAAVPFTTALATTVAVRRPRDAPPVRPHIHGPVDPGPASAEPG